MNEQKGSLRNEYGTAEVQEYLLNGLRIFHKFCIDNNIKYSVWDGTMIGAVRHKGFIPWDDDVDVILDRKNYKKLLKMYQLISPCSFSIERRLWVRRITFKGNKWAVSGGGTIDLFVWDNIPDKKIINGIKVFFLRILQGMMKDIKALDFRSYSYMYRPVVFITSIMGLPFKDNTLFRWYNRISQWGNDKKTIYRGVYNEPFAYSGKIKYKLDDFSFMIVPFENIEVMMLVDYDYLLTKTYGDYMTLPPIGERKKTHE